MSIRDAASKVLLVCGALLVSGLLAEGVLRGQFALQDGPPPHWDRSLGREWRWAQAHLRAGSAIGPGEAVYDPDLGWLEKPDMDANGVQTNSVGMRARREFSTERTASPRLVLIGDSYTFGAFARDEEAFHYRLEQEFLPGWEILNMGVSGHGPDQMLLFYEKFGRAYQPEIVVFGFFERGFFRMFNAFRSYAKPVLELGADGALHVTGVPVISPEALYESYASGERRIAVPFGSHLIARMARTVARSEARSAVERGDSSWQLMAAVLRRFRDDAVAAGSLPFLLIFPDRPHECDGCVYEKLGEFAVLEAQELGMPSLWLTPAFREHPADELFRPADSGGHLTAAGNALTARLLYEALVTAGYVRSSPEGPVASR